MEWTGVFRDTFGYFPVKNITADPYPNARLNTVRRLYYKTAGGDPRFSVAGAIVITDDAEPVDLTNWLNSVNRQNSILVAIDEKGLQPLYNFIINVQIREEVGLYINILKIIR